MTKSADEFTCHLAMLLRDKPAGTTADLTPDLCAFWDGYDVRFVLLRDDGSGTFDEEFELNDWLWSDFEDDFYMWLDKQRYTERNAEAVTRFRHEHPITPHLVD